MRYRETTLSRIFVLRLEHGDRLPDVLENFANQKNINSALCLFLGGVKDGSRLVEGPAADVLPPDPLIRALAGVHEIVGLGTLFRDESGAPKLHAHAAAGRNGKTETGCIRPGIETWHILELVVLEMNDCGARRKQDPVTGFSLLDV
jgi:predicted DNA-binding protein with PD1-like motif